MENNWIILPIVGVGILILVIFLFRQNLKDKKDLITTLNDDYKKPDENNSEVNNDVNE